MGLMQLNWKRGTQNEGELSRMPAPLHAMSKRRPEATSTQLKDAVLKTRNGKSYGEGGVAILIQFFNDYYSFNVR